VTVQPAAKLAIYLPSLAGGGAERAMLNLAQGLAERGCGLDLVLARAHGPYLKEVHEPIQLVDLKASRVLTSLPALVRYLRRGSVALISALNYANVVALWADLGSRRSRVWSKTEHHLPARLRTAQAAPEIVPYLVRRFYPGPIMSSGTPAAWLPT
jgi:hypothetical protein